MGKKKKPPPQRTIRVHRAPGDDDVGVCSIASDDEVAFYAFKEIGSAIGGRGFALHRLGLGNLYHVRVGEPEDCSCECLGYLRTGSCKHVLGLLALVENGVV